MTREEMRYKLNELRMMLNDGEHGEEQGILVEIISELDKGEWIPVSERLPKAFETVLRTRVENGWNGTTYTIVDTGCICPADHNIIAWMPLPEPYKADMRGE